MLKLILFIAVLTLVFKWGQFSKEKGKKDFSVKILLSIAIAMFILAILTNLQK